MSLLPHFLILSHVHVELYLLVVTPNSHVSILGSFTPSLLYWTFVVARVSVPYNAGLATALHIFPLASRASVCHTTLHCTSSDFPRCTHPMSYTFISVPPFLFTHVPRYMRLFAFFNSSSDFNLYVQCLLIHLFCLFEPTFHPFCFWSHYNTPMIYNQQVE